MMNTQNPKPSRSSMRLKGFDYSSERAYLVTICTAGFYPYFGILDKGNMILNELAKIVRNEWLATQDKRPGVRIDEFGFMPDLFHAIVIIHDRNALRSHPNPNPEKKGREYYEQQGKFYLEGPSKNLSSIIRGFKAAATSQVLKNFCLPHPSIWHRGFYDHILRNDAALREARNFILCNPGNRHRETLNAMLGQVYRPQTRKENKRISYGKR